MYGFETERFIPKLDDAAKVRAMTEVSRGYFIGSMDEVIRAIAYDHADMDDEGRWYDLNDKWYREPSAHSVIHYQR